MAKISSSTRKRLEWVRPAIEGINRATGGIINQQARVKQTGDPLTAIVVLDLANPMKKETRGPFRTYIREWAHSYNCTIPVITILDRSVQMEVIIKERIWVKDHEGRYFQEPIFKKFESKRSKPV